MSEQVKIYKPSKNGTLQLVKVVEEPPYIDGLELLNELNRDKGQKFSRGRVKRQRYKAGKRSG